MGRREDIDREVHQWALSQKSKGVKVTPMDIRHKAFEVGQTFSRSGFKASQNWYVNWKKRTGYECSQSEQVKTPKKTYTAAFKLEAVQRASQMESASQASLALNVSRRCLQRWKKEINIIATVAEEAGTAVYRRPGQGRKVNDSELDRNLLSWIQASWSEKINVTPSMVRVKALEICKESSFKASIGWYVKFARRYNLDLKEKKCDTLVDKKDIEIKLKILPHDQTCNGIVMTEVSSGKPVDTGQLAQNVTVEGWTEHYDRVLLDWVVSKIQGGEKIHKSLIKAKAVELCSDPMFEPSQSWLSSWVQKNRLYNICEDSEEDLSLPQQFSPISVYTHSHISVGKIPPRSEPLPGIGLQSGFNYLQYDQSRTVAMSASEANIVSSLSGEDLLTLTSEVVEVASTEEVVTDSPPDTVGMPERVEESTSEEYVVEHIVTDMDTSPEEIHTSRQLTELYCKETALSH
jgi:transposase-like protein